MTIFIPIVVRTVVVLDVTLNHGFFVVVDVIFGAIVVVFDVVVDIIVFVVSVVVGTVDVVDAKNSILKCSFLKTVRNIPF